jgi:hypothetical protein
VDATPVTVKPAGTGGSVGPNPVPHRIRTSPSVFYPDKRPTQRVGIVPDIKVTPMIEGIRAGRDELIEEAIRLIEGGGHGRPSVGRR